MGKPGKDGKPRGKMSAYAFFVQTCREEHRKKHPGESVVFADFSRKCAEKWKVTSMNAPEKKRFDEMAMRDKMRWENEMDHYEPPAGQKRRRKRTKDPNAPKRALSAFFWFCGEERGAVKAANPTFGVGDIAKQLGKRWEMCPNRPKYEEMARRDKARYGTEMDQYKKDGTFKKAKMEAAPAEEEDEESEEEEEDDE